MYARSINPPKDKSFFLFGPRGTGKSLWVRNTFPKALYFDLLESELYVSLSASPQRLSSLIPKGHDDWIIIDEVQKIPALLDEVHRLIEKERFKFILTGSNARKLKHQSANLLAGRALTLHLHPLTASELGKDFNLRHSLQFGQLPMAYLESDPKAYLKSYVKTYLQEEIQQEGLTRNLGAFTRFLEAASFSQGSILNISAVARECSVARKVVEQYFMILEDLLLAYLIPPFTKRTKRRLAQHPKFYYFDPGVYRVLRPQGPLDSSSDMDGPALETLFFHELNAAQDYLKLDGRIFYWRTVTGLEVDFVYYGENGIFAFEVKRESKPKSDSLRGLKAFLADYPSAKAYLFYGGERKMREGPIEILPLEQNLPQMALLLKGKV